jgi:hypothetical protein
MGLTEIDPIMGKIGEKETKIQFIWLKKKKLSLFRANAPIFSQNKINYLDNGNNQIYQKTQQLNMRI